MTNLEFYKDYIYEIQKDLFDKGLCIKDSIGIAICNVYEKQIGLSAFMPTVLDWLLEEHKEPIKLKQWEKDLLEVGYCTNRRFCDFDDLLALCDRGYFRGVTDIKGSGDTSMTIQEILDNCEVIDK